MSRIGLKPIVIPAGVDFKVDDNNTVTVKGPNGTLTQAVNKDIKIDVNGSEVTFSRPSDNKEHRAMHGLYRALVANMVTGVTTGFSKKLEVNGVGYRANKQGKKIYIQVAYLLATPETLEREFGVFQNIKDNYPKYVVSMDEFNLDRDGIRHCPIRDFLLAPEWA